LRPGRETDTTKSTEMARRPERRKVADPPVVVLAVSSGLPGCGRPSARPGPPKGPTDKVIVRLEFGPIGASPWTRTMRRTNPSIGGKQDPQNSSRTPCFNFTGLSRKLSSKAVRSSRSQGGDQQTGRRRTYKSWELTLERIGRQHCRSGAHARPCPTANPITDDRQARLGSRHVGGAMPPE